MHLFIQVKLDVGWVNKWYSEFQFHTGVCVCGSTYCSTASGQTPEDHTDLNLTSTFTCPCLIVKFDFPSWLSPHFAFVLPIFPPLLSGCHLTWHVECTMINLALWPLTISRTLKIVFHHSWHGCQCYISLRCVASLNSKKSRVVELRIRGADPLSCFF